MREEAAFNHFAVKTALDHPLRIAFPRCFWKTGVILLLFTDSLPGQLNSALYAQLLNPRSLLQSTQVYTFTFQKNWIPLL